MTLQVESVLRSYLAAGDNADYAEMTRWLDDRVVVHSPGGATNHGIGANIAAWVAAHEGLADLTHEIHEVIAQPPWVVARIVITGNHHGSFLGLASTGKSIRVDHALFARVADGRMVELWEIVDTGRALQQLGVMSGQALAPGERPSG